MSMLENEHEYLEQSQDCHMQVFIYSISTIVYLYVLPNVSPFSPLQFLFCLCLLIMNASQYLCVLSPAISVFTGLKAAEISSD